MPRVGHRWLDFTIAAVAIVISLISLGVGFINARSEQRMVAASSWPFLVYSTGRSIIDGRATISLQIANEGVGPARLKTLFIRYHGKSARGLAELLHLCCGVPAGTTLDQVMTMGVTKESRAIVIYAPRDSVTIAEYERTPTNAAIWDRLAKERLNLTFEACYCSVLDECWTSDLTYTGDPVPVDRCVPQPGSYIE